MRQSAGEIVSLTGLRGLAATAVAASHFTIVPAELFVDMFFALSGFVICLVYLPAPGERVDWRDYAIARFARIYPLYIATSLVAGLLYATGWSWESPLDHFPTRQAFHEVTLTTVLAVRTGITQWNGPAWSVAAEWWTYFTIFPLLVHFGSRISKEWACLVVVACTLALALALGQASVEDPTRDVFALGRSFCGFAGGWVAYRFVAEGSAAPSRWAADLLVLAFVLVALLGPALIGHGVYLFLPLLPLIVWALVKSQGVASRILSSKPLVYLGTISYSIYLIHFLFRLVSAGLERRYNTEFAWQELLLPGMVATLLVAPLTYHFLERPARNFIRARFGHARARAKA
jgi:peptidoglycan/LPS O-acetylase OafA/YrhL